MAALLRAAAVLVGLSNATFYSVVGDAGFEEPFTWKLEPWPLTTLYAISAIAAGLSISGASLRFTRRDLQGGSGLLKSCTWLYLPSWPEVYWARQKG